MSNSGKFLQKQGPPPIISNDMYKSVSQYRKNTLAQEAERGFYRDGFGNVNKKSELSPASYVSTLKGNLNKTAQVGSGFNGGGNGTGWRGGSGEASRQAPAVYSPLWLNSNLNLPQSSNN